MKKIIGIILLLIHTFCNANGVMSLSIPMSPGNFQSDRFRAGELDCSMAIGSGVNVEFGVMGVIANANPLTQPATNNISNNPNTKDVGVYGRIIVPIGAPKNRIDCTHLYNLELNKRQMEIEKLEFELKNLRNNLKFENTK